VNPGGLVIVIAGVWLGCQVFGGNALERLGILSPAGSSSSTAPALATTPAGPSTTATWT
jgi:hypothetical protein